MMWSRERCCCGCLPPLCDNCRGTRFMRKTLRLQLFLHDKGGLVSFGRFLPFFRRFRLMNCSDRKIDPENGADSRCGIHGDSKDGLRGGSCQHKLTNGPFATLGYVLKIGPVPVVGAHQSRVARIYEKPLPVDPGQIPDCSVARPALFEELRDIGHRHRMIRSDRGADRDFLVQNILHEGLEIPCRGSSNFKVGLKFLPTIGLIQGLDKDEG